jgi:hypothetical protein
MMNLFGDKLEAGVLEQFGEVRPQNKIKNQETMPGGEANFSELMVTKKSGFGSQSSGLMKIGQMQSQP